MEKLRVWFTDFWPTFDPNSNPFLDALGKRYDVNVTQPPDVLFHSVFGSGFMEYDCLRVFYTGECCTPDFNACDYAIGFDYIDFGDRYLRLPLYLFNYEYRAGFDLAMTKHERVEEALKLKKRFCSFVYSSGGVSTPRYQFERALCGYKHVDSGGRAENNIGYAVENKLAFERVHKFSIAFENCVYPGYSTEKIVESFAAATVPLYYGDPTIGRQFNPNAFLNLSGCADVDQMVGMVKELDEDDARYEYMLRQPILLPDSNLPNYEALDRFILNAVRWPRARRRPPRNAWGGGGVPVFD